MIALRRSKGSAVARLVAQASILAAAGLLHAEPLVVSEADRAVAVEWAAKVNDDLKSSDPREAVRLLLRAVRWDPSRWDDYRSAIELLESVDPEAAARHAAAELRGQARFARIDAALLSRLAKVAADSEDDATWRETADLTRAAAEQMAKFGAAQALQAAQLWTDAGSAYASLGDFEAASDAYDEMQQIVAATESDRLKGAYRWDLIAGFHLDADQPTRAAPAIELLREREGETPRLLVLQSRLALQLGEPLAAIDHAEQAIDKLAGAHDEAAEGAYAAYVEAMHTVNQSDRAAERLAKDLAAEPDKVALALATIDARTNAGQYEQAWTDCGVLIKKLASRLPSVDGHLGADSSAEPGQLDQLADAAARRLRLALRLGLVSQALDESMGWAERLGDLDLVWDELAALCHEDGFRSEASEWLDKQKADPDAPAAENLASATIAYLINRPDEVTEYVLARLERAIDQNLNAQAVADGCAMWADYLLDNRHYGAAGALLVEAINRIEGERDATAIGGLRVQLARAMVSQQEEAERRDPAVLDEAVRLLGMARSESPDDGFVAHYAVFYSLYVGRTAEAIATSEEVFEQWTTPDAESQFGSQRFREVNELFAAALLLRDEPGDADRAADLLEASLDNWPRSAMAMTYLAWHDSRSPAGLGRALRLAEEATRISPDAADSRGFLGIVQMRAGQTEKGIESLRTAIAMADDQQISLWERALFRQELAEALRANGRAEEAEVVESATSPAD